jgi:hypothetical protein
MELFRKSFSEHLKFASAMAAEQRPELRPNLLAPLRLCSEMAFVGTRSREWPDDTSGDKKRGLRTIDAEIDVGSQEWMDVLSVTRTDPRARANWSSAIPGIRHRDSPFPYDGGMNGTPDRTESLRATSAFPTANMSRLAPG